MAVKKGKKAMESALSKTSEITPTVVNDMILLKQQRKKDRLSVSTVSSEASEGHSCSKAAKKRKKMVGRSNKKLTKKKASLREARMQPKRKTAASVASKVLKDVTNNAETDTKHKRKCSFRGKCVENGSSVSIDAKVKMCNILLPIKRLDLKAFKAKRTSLMQKCKKSEPGVHRQSINGWLKVHLSFVDLFLRSWG